MADSVWGLDVEAELDLVVDGIVEADIDVVIDGVEQLHASAGRANNASPTPFMQRTIASRSWHQGVACPVGADGHAHIRRTGLAPV